MNFNRNPRFEQFDLDDDAAIYDFFDGAVEEIYDTLPAGLSVPSATVVRHFAGLTMGAAFRMEEKVGDTIMKPKVNPKSAMRMLKKLSK